MLRTKSGLPKNCVWTMDRENGKRRVRFRNRKAGFSVYLTGTPWSDEFMRQYAAAVEGSKARTEIASGAKRTVAGTLNALIVSYYGSPGFCDLKPSTQAVRRNILEGFRTDYGDLPVKGLTRGVLDGLMGKKANTPMAANNLIKVLRYLLDHAVAVNMVAANPAIGVRKYRQKGDGHHTWTEDEIARFQARHPSDTRAGLALMLYTAQRRGDVVRMGRQHVTGDLIAVRQEKTDTPLLIPLHPELMMALDALPRTNMTFLMTERGAPFTSAGFGNWFRERCDEAGLSHCSAHGLRKAAATRLANLGCSNEQIKAITGHRSDASLAPYTRAADQQRLARQAITMQIKAGSELVQQPIHAGPKRG
jgi:integrase